MESNLSDGQTESKGPFRFLAMWFDHKACRNLVKNIWSKQVVGCPMFVLKQKLNNLKISLKTWNSEVFGNVHLKVSLVVDNLSSIQHRIQEDNLNDELYKLEASTQVNHQQALFFVKSFWKEKA